MTPLGEERETTQRDWSSPVDQFDLRTPIQRAQAKWDAEEEAEIERISVPPLSIDERREIVDSARRVSG